MQRIVLTIIITWMCLCAFPQEPAFNNMTIEEIFNKGFDYTNGGNGEIIDVDKARECFLIIAEKDDEYPNAANIAKAVLVEENLVSCEEALRYFGEIENWIIQNKSSDNSFLMNFLSRYYYYYSGEGYACFPNDSEKSHNWAKTSAEFDDAEGQYLYGAHYCMGIGTEVDVLEGIKWMTKSAEKGYLEAMKALSSFYKVGRNVQQDYGKYAYWLKKVAEAGDPEYQCEYSAILFANEFGLPQDIDKALYWSKKAAMQGYIPAYYLVGYIYVCCDDNDNALFWCRKGVAENDPDCCWLLSEIMYDDQTNPERIDALEKAAELNEKSAQAEMAKLHAFGRIQDADQQWGMQALKMLSDEGNPRAMAIYGTFLFWGQNIQKNEADGAKLLRLSARNGDRFGMEFAKQLNIEY